MSVQVVVGANRGIGLELVRQLRSEGYTVVGVCRTSSPELAATGCEVIDGIEITKADSVSALATELTNRSIALVVIAAGILKRTSLDALELDVVRQQLEVNAIGPLSVARALLPAVKRGGRIVFLTSRMGSIADNSSGGHYGYRMSKAALNAAARSLALDLRPREISVGILHPGFVRTDMTGGHGDLSAEESARMLLQRIDELGPATSGAFLHANGQVLPW